MPQDRNFEANLPIQDKPHSQRGGRRTRGFLLDVALLPVALTGGHGLLPSSQDVFIAPPAIFAQAIQYTDASSLLALSGSTQTLSFSVKHTESQANQSCGGQPVIPGDKISSYASYGVTFQTDSPSGIKVAQGLVYSQEMGENQNSTFISTDNGQTYTLLQGVTLLSWSGHTTNGEADLFIAKFSTNDYSPLPPYNYGLFQNIDGCHWNLIAQTPKSSLEGAWGLGDSWSTTGITWSKDGSSATITAVNDLSTAGKQSAIREEAIINLSLNGNGHIETNYILVPNPLLICEMIVASGISISLISILIANIIKKLKK